MFGEISNFWHLIVVSFLAIFPPVNPFGTALILDPYLEKLDKDHRRNAAVKIALNCLMVCSISAIFGGSIFKLFGISIPAVQIAGGILISKMGFGVLNSRPEDAEMENPEEVDVEKHWIDFKKNLFYPFSFPMTTGAGTISVLLTLSADGYDPISSQHFSNILALCLGSLLMCGLIFVCYNYSAYMTKKIGAGGRTALHRLSGFITLCVGIQILITGVVSVLK
jgi:multiple antibiotic resistance protein